MKVEYIFIGQGLDGKIKVDDYPKKKLLVTEVTVQSAASGANGTPIKIFEVDYFRYKGSVYAVAIGRSTDGNEIIKFIEMSGVKPIPEELL
ncbi:hypothetical protein [Citrobacter youngae]|uniref:hypothetical protein n=1 Tax=Citrobacter youngae TaxID=133448 RepID=UPI0018667F2D|nr:hypothetical protein [Citrobacter youngae]